MHNLKKYIEKGRSMVEMLAALAIMGVLAIGGIQGYRYAMDKKTANDVLNYVNLGHTLVSAMREIPTQATPADLSELKYPAEEVPYYYGDDTSFYIGMPAITKGVCKIIANQIYPPIKEIYVVGEEDAEEDEPLTAELCADGIELEYAFDLGEEQEIVCWLECGEHGRPNESCLACSCDHQFGGKYCDECAGAWEDDEETGEECGYCPDRYQDRSGCVCSIKMCEEYNEDCSCARCNQSEFEYKPKQTESETCKSESGVCGWACEVDEGGGCNYNYLNQPPYLIDVLPPFCSFKYDTGVPKPCAAEYESGVPKPCAVTYKNAKPATCTLTYKNESTTAGTTGNLEGVGCSGNQYFYPRWLDESGTAITANPAHNAPLYGTCHDRTTFVPESTAEIGRSGEFTETQSCPNEQYCYPRWTDKSCGSTAITANPTDGATLYGTCHERTTFTPNCTAEVGSTALINETQSCPEGQYCYPRWTDKSCGGTAITANPENGSMIYGTCHERTTFTPNCTAEVESTANLDEQDLCPNNQYCYPQWTDKSCGSTAITANPEHETILYGTCHDRDTFSPSCTPLGKRATETELTEGDKKCPPEQYCYPQWIAEDCSTPIPAEGAGTLYGNCLQRDNFEVLEECPYEKKS